MHGRCVVAEGTDDTGVSWVIWARRDSPRDGDLLSMIRLTDAGGRILHVGVSSGPPLYPGRLLNITTNGSEEGPRALLGRVDPDVRRLELRVHDGSRRNVPLYDCAEIPEVRFAALLLPREELLDSVAGFGAKGPELERFDLRFQQGRWETLHPHAARPATLLPPARWRAVGEDLAGRDVAPEPGCPLGGALLRGALVGCALVGGALGRDMPSAGVC